MANSFFGKTEIEGLTDDDLQTIFEKKSSDYPEEALDMAYDEILKRGLEKPYWYYRKDNKTLGPVKEEDISRLLQSSCIDANSYVWRVGFKEWRRISDVKAKDIVIGIVPPPFDESTNKSMDPIQAMDTSISADNIKAIDKPTAKRRITELFGKSRWIPVTGIILISIVFLFAIAVLAVKINPELMAILDKNVFSGTNTSTTTASDNPSEISGAFGSGDTASASTSGSVETSDTTSAGTSVSSETWDPDLKYKIYYNELNKISMKYPEDWEIKEINQLVVVAFLSPMENNSDTFRENVNIIIEGLPDSGTDLQTYVEIGLTQLQNGITDFKLNASRDTTIGNIPAKILEYTGKQGQYDLSCLQAFLVTDNTAIVATYTAAGNKTDKYLSTAVNMINSLKIGVSGEEEQDTTQAAAQNTAQTTKRNTAQTATTQAATSNSGQGDTISNIKKEVNESGIEYTLTNTLDTFEQAVFDMNFRLANLEADEKLTEKDQSIIDDIKVSSDLLYIILNTKEIESVADDIEMYNFVKGEYIKIQPWVESLLKANQSDDYQQMQDSSANILNLLDVMFESIYT